ncbi:MAG: riboflavin biosynthesis protein RibF [Planctomycetes bacterium]|nr:riboflavin biosynthesis protein RibF [Planctomycetota bacterium]
MLVIRDLSQLPDSLRWPVVTLGMFDGVHQGHQKVIRETVRWARRQRGESVVLTFDRHPASVLGHKPPSHITSLAHRLALFEALGVDVCVVLQFTRRFARTSAEDFIKRIIADALGAKGVLWGFDCAFGRNREGDIGLLRRFGEELGFTVRRCASVRLGRDTVSSTAIRKAIVSGELQKAERMLGRPVSVLGTVVRGAGRGHQLGFATANLDLHHEVHPPIGVYAARARIRGREFPAAVNIGRCPTFGRASALPITVEVHVLDFNEPIRGLDMEVQFIRRLRGERKFRSPAALIAQMHKDVAAVRRLAKKP